MWIVASETWMETINLQYTLLHFIAFSSFQAIAGAKIVDIARFGDELIEQRTNAIYKNKNKAGKVVSRGVAFPVCISVNETVCHCSPLESDTEVCMRLYIAGVLCSMCVPCVQLSDPIGTPKKTGRV